MTDEPTPTTRTFNIGVSKDNFRWHLLIQLSKGYVKIVQYPDVLDSNMATQFHREIEDVVKAGANIVLLDLKNLTSITSSGLMVLVEAFKLIRSAGCNLFICSLNEQVRILFELTGLDLVFQVFASLDEFNSRMLLKK